MYRGHSMDGHSKGGQSYIKPSVEECPPPQGRRVSPPKSPGRRRSRGWQNLRNARWVMRRNLIPVPLAIILLATVLPFSVFSAEYPSRVDRVVLYPDMAEITRVVEVDRPEAIVALPGLTPNLLPDTLSARVVSGAARITGVSVEDLFRTEPVDERVGGITRRIEELSDAKRRAEEAGGGGRRGQEPRGGGGAAPS